MFIKMFIRGPNFRKGETKCLGGWGGGGVGVSWTPEVQGISNHVIHVRTRLSFYVCSRDWLLSFSQREFQVFTNHRNVVFVRFSIFKQAFWSRGNMIWLLLLSTLFVARCGGQTSSSFKGRVCFELYTVCCISILILPCACVVIS